jgi:hypothetical protein
MSGRRPNVNWRRAKHNVFQTETLPRLEALPIELALLRPFEELTPIPGA